MLATHPNKQIATGTAKDFSSIDSMDWNAIRGSATITESAPTAANCHDTAPSRRRTTTPEATVPPTRTSCMNATGTAITTTFASTSRAGRRVPVSRRFQLVPWCSMRQAVAVSRAIPME